MDYYKERAKALRMIDKMATEGMTVDQIEFKVSTAFGFGRSMVEKRLELLRCISTKE